MIKRTHIAEDGTKSLAIYTDCEQYRFILTRKWSKTGQRHIAFIGLNPSTATEYQNDPTVARCINYAKAWGYDSMTMLNAFGYRSTDPKGLKSVADPNGKGNDRYILKECRTADFILLCWGTHAALNNRSEELLKKLRTLDKPLHCLKLTQAGLPSHPLYLRKDLKPIIYKPDPE